MMGRDTPWMKGLSPSLDGPSVVVLSSADLWFRDILRCGLMCLNVCDEWSKIGSSSQSVME